MWQFIDHWQTLIAGLLALAAGVITVVATMKSANREIAVAQEQTKAAQHQTEVMRENERRGIAREGYAFHDARGGLEGCHRRRRSGTELAASEPYVTQ
jgi:hypothetical protein